MQVDGAGVSADSADDVSDDSHLASGFGDDGDPHHPRHSQCPGSRMEGVIGQVNG